MAISNIRGKNLSAWRIMNKVFSKVSDEWKLASKVYVKVNGAWVLVFLREMPSNVVLLLSSADVPKTTILTDYASKYPMGGSDGVTTTGGNLTHTGHSGQTNTLTSTSTAVYVALWKLFPNAYNITVSTHNHTTNHTHTDPETNIPLTMQVIPATTTNGIIPKGSFILRNISGTAPNMTDVSSTYSSRYIRFELSTSGPSTDLGRHYHGYTGNSGIRSVSITKDTYTGSTQYYSHYHSITHAHTTQYNEPACRTLCLLSLDRDFYFDELPIGTILPFTTTVLPSGWSIFTDADDKLIMINPSPNLNSGSTTHDIPSSHHTTSGEIKNASISSRLESTKNRYFLIGHTHTFDHGHSTQVNWMPPYKRIVLGIKN